MIKEAEFKEVKERGIRWGVKEFTDRGEKNIAHRQLKFTAMAVFSLFLLLLIKQIILSLLFFSLCFGGSGYLAVKHRIYWIPNTVVIRGKLGQFFGFLELLIALSAFAIGIVFLYFQITSAT